MNELSIGAAPILARIEGPRSARRVLTAARMKRAPLLFLLIAACGAPADVETRSSSVVFTDHYGWEAYNIPPEYTRLARASPVIVSASVTTTNADGSVAFALRKFGPSMNICPEVFEYPQPQLSNGTICSGVLVSDGEVVTAGHCRAALVGSRVAFGFQMSAQTTYPVSLPAQDVYTVAAIAAGPVVSSDGADWVVLRLDRPVVRDFARLAPAPIAPVAGPWTGLLTAFYPEGLPLKMVHGYPVIANVPPAVFGAQLNSAPGSSGAPVWDQTTLLLDGIVSRSWSTVFLPDARGCNYWAGCTTAGVDCAPTYVVRADAFRGSIHPTPLGTVDGFDANGNVKGWVVDANFPDRQLAIMVLVDGVPPWPNTPWGVANYPRPDVNTATGLPGNHGFQIWLPDARDGKPHTVQVFVKDAAGNTSEVPGSPKTFKMALPVGAIDGIGYDGRVSGWTYDPDTPAASVAYSILIDNNDPWQWWSYRYSANLPRPDVNAAFGITGAHGFDFVLPAKYRDGKSHWVQIAAYDTGGGDSAYQWIGKSLVWSTAPIGYLDVVDENGVAGWALDPDSPTATTSIALYLDGDLGAGIAVPVAPANQPRPDVNAATGYPGDHGFRVGLPTSVRDGRSHMVYAYALDAQGGTPVRLPGSPMSFTLCPSCDSGRVCDAATHTCVCPSGTAWCTTASACLPPTSCVVCPAGQGLCGCTNSCMTPTDCTNSCTPDPIGPGGGFDLCAKKPWLCGE